MSSFVLRPVLVLVLAFALVGSPALVKEAAAQSDSADAAASAQAPQAPPAPPPVTWIRTATASVMWLSSTTTQTALTFAADGTRNSEHWTHTIAGDYSYVTVKIQDVSRTVSDSQSLRYLARYAKSPNARVYYLFRPAFKRNVVQAVDYRFEELFGVGFYLVKTPKLNFDVIPVAGAVQQDKNIPAVNGAHGTYGLYQNAGGTISQKVTNGRLESMWGWSQFLLWLEEPTVDDRRLQFQVQLTGTIVPRLSLSLQYSIDKDAQVATGSQKDDQRVTVGLRVQY